MVQTWFSNSKTKQDYHEDYQTNISNLLLFLLLIKIVVLCTFLVLKGFSHITIKAMEVCAKVDERFNNYMMNLYKKHVNKSLNQ